MGLGSRYLKDGKVPIPDVLTLAKSYARPDVTAFECKATRADFLADTGTGKWERYRPHCNRVYFACVQGLLTKKDIPAGAGLVEVAAGLQPCCCPRNNPARSIA